MFFDELQPIFQELTREPIAFLGGFFSGTFQLNLGEDPVKSWLDEQAGSSSSSSTSSGSPNLNNGRSNGPQTISID
ncbi:hypothetical protein IQ235_09865 [Oscillatoriales cyanobacterium LEGE 11467]|uniref:Uncharacterized protein n=1 Tax=Zarconia navalis LEGE 11467 TaxID=1828826 RepID=A0A928VZJ1_9CYAN|nr:hypothetical protein [Zarconia navalis]MBE9041083.1 hypothetical protein [Zarconia navalis LEGE 11467]